MNKIKIACVGDSITFGAHLENREEECYPSLLQKWLGDGYDVRNFGVSGCTLIRKGTPTVWTQLPEVKELNPELIFIMLGTNDTCGGDRKCWDHKDEYYGDYRDLVDILQALPAKPKIWLCCSPPMEMTTPGLDEVRIDNLEERKPRLQELREQNRKLAAEKGCGFIDMNTPLKGRSEMFRIGDGVHPNKVGAKAIAEIIFNTIK